MRKEIYLIRGDMKKKAVYFDTKSFIDYRQIETYLAAEYRWV
jgi:hypothetical protein